MCGRTGASSRTTSPGHSPQPCGPDAVLVAGREQHLHPHADAEHRPAAGHAPPDDLRAVHPRQPGHARGESAHAGHDQTVRLHRRVRVRRHRDVGADPGQRALGGAQVPGPVVEHHHVRTAHGDPDRAPLVDGTPSTRGSSATASRSARATALNCASTTWWALRPDSTRTCRQTCADAVSDSQMCRVSVVSYEPMSSHDLRLGVHEVRAAGQVDGRLDQRLVQRHGGVAEAADAGLVAERLAQRLAERERGVLDRVVRVDLEVAVGAHDEVEAAVLAELAEHVVEERHPGRDVGARRCRRGRARPTTADSFVVRCHPGGTAHADRSSVAAVGTTSSSAARKASISSAVPAVTRSQSRQPDVADQDAVVEQRLTRRRARRRSVRTGRSSRPSRRPRTRARAARRRCGRAALAAARRSAAARRRARSAARAAAWVSADRW